MGMGLDIVRSNYSKWAEYEWKRLVADPFHRLEYETTRRFLRKYLPKKGLILDAGGGPGRYTVDLARAGYRVVLLDPVPEHLALACKKIDESGVGARIEGIMEGSITDLSCFNHATFDAVICLGGPLSHVQSAQMRRKAVKELVRVAKHRAPVFISVMSRFGVLLATPSGWPQEVGLTSHFKKIVRRGDDYRWRGKGYCHFFTARELRKLVEQEKAAVLAMAGLEGLIASEGAGNDFAKNHPKAWKTWVSIHNEICTEPFVVDASAHMLAIARKK
jgi:ubiquinone/menaquinone biosynthesis C-methylase UbiE